MKPKFRILFLEESELFLDSLDKKAKAKVLSNIDNTGKMENNNLFKKLQGEIWELRTMYNKTYYRFFAFWDKSTTPIRSSFLHMEL